MGVDVIFMKSKQQLLIRSYNYQDNNLTNSSNRQNFNTKLCKKMFIKEKKLI